VGGPPANCDDENPCTDDSCDPEDGCLHVNNLVPCDDDNACTANEACLDGQCQNGLAILCNDLNICTDDSCDEDFGCLYVVNQAACEDGDACTADDYCEMGDCVSGPAMDCDDQDVCTIDVCVPPNGCAYSPAADGTPCGFEMECKEGLCKDICEQQTGNVQFSYSGSIATWTVPECVEQITIETWGAEGGKNNPCSQKGGRGARMKGDFDVVEGEVLKIVVGQKGQDRGSNTSNQSGSGGGGSFVWKQQGTALLIASGAGGGGAICTSGGSPNYATGKNGVTGTSGTSDTTNAQQGGSNGSDGNGTGKGKGWNNVKNDPQGYGSGGEKGGYGGGGKVASNHGGGGGGGYSGGGGMDYTGNPAPAGGGGGSYNNGSNQSNSAGVQTGNGKVVISW